MFKTGSKRARVSEPSVVDVMHFGRLLMSNDPFKHRAPREEDTAFRALFGCGPVIVLSLWNKLVAADLVPVGGTMTHLLWTLMYCKQYGKWSTMRKLTNTDPKTLRKWINQFFYNIEILEGDVVSHYCWCDFVCWILFKLSLYLVLVSLLQIQWKNRKKGDILNDCLVSVDSTDFQVPFAGRKFHSHKYKFGSAVRYEVAICILTGDLVWVNGPYEPGIWNDIAIFRNSLLSMLEDGERAEGDDGYRGAAPKFIKCPASIGNVTAMETQQAFVRRRHETINRRFKQWGILKQVYRGDVTKHGQVFRLVAIITQLAIESGEPLFQVDYEDPEFDNLYFDDNDVLEDNTEDERDD